MSSGGIRQTVFATVWAFVVRPENRHKFEHAYGPNGDWVRLFRRADGYLNTELHRDPENPQRYITLDFWRSRERYEQFKQQAKAAYQEIDARCELLTEDEVLLGEFDSMAALAAAFPGLGPSTTVPVFAIRAATADDLPAIIQLERSVPLAAHWSEHAYATAFEKDALVRILLVAEDTNTQVQGFVVGRIAADECELENIVVSPQVVRTGVGSALLEELTRAARARGARRLYLEVRESNQAARGLYQRFGFGRDSLRDAYYRDPEESAILFSLTL